MNTVTISRRDIFEILKDCKLFKKKDKKKAVVQEIVTHFQINNDRIIRIFERDLEKKFFNNFYSRMNKINNHVQGRYDQFAISNENWLQGDLVVTYYLNKIINEVPQQRQKGKLLKTWQCYSSKIKIGFEMVFFLTSAEN